MITGAIFDLDGTLTDSMPIWETAGLEYLHTQGITPPAGLRDTLLPKSLLQTIGYFQRELGVAQTAEEIYRGINQLVEGYYFTEVTLKPGVERLLTALSARGIPCAIATAQERYITERCLTRLGIWGRFAGICTCTEIGKGKEFPDVYEAARALIGSERSSTIVFEDAPHAVRTAKAAGFLVAGVYDLSAHGAQDKIKAMADYYYTTLDDCEGEAL